MSMREHRRDYEVKMKQIGTVDHEMAQLKLKYATLLGPCKMKRKVHAAIARAMEVENCTFKMRKNSLFAEPSDSRITFKSGDRIRIGDSPAVYRITKNDGLPTSREKLVLKIRRTFVAAILHLQGFKEGHLGSDDVDMMEFKSALQKADAEFQVCPSPLLAHFLPRQDFQNGNSTLPTSSRSGCIEFGLTVMQRMSGFTNFRCKVSGIKFPQPQVIPVFSLFDVCI